MTAEQVEYDRFGPWVIKISDADPLPPLFEPLLVRDEPPLLSVKIPRQIERRNARPGMHLYDYVVSLYAADLVILERDGNDVRSETFQYEHIQYLQHSEALLNGRLRLAMANRVYDLPFNTVSSELMQRLVDLIRQRYIERGGPKDLLETSPLSTEELSYYFTRLLADELARHPTQRLLAVQQEQPVASSESNWWRWLLFGVLGRTLLESLHFGDGIELTIVDRGQTYRRRREAIYATDRTYVPLNKMVDVSWGEVPNNRGVSTLSVLTRAPVPVTAVFANENMWVSNYLNYLRSCLPLSA